ncbi:MAG: hypothetical protein RMK64_13600 [Rhodovarius sp.]|nr:hypothetical protein [Rhodovarius sp.]MDW8316000.1 hypothetical protein [Rhodovarius sp.]
MIRLLVAAVALLALAGCGNRFSADEYATRAVQQANRVSQGVVVGFRPVRITADGAVGAAAGGAAGGAVGGAIGAPDRVASALGAVGGALLGSLVGTAAERALTNADAFEYVVRKLEGGLVSVTQRDLVPLPVGARVLVIEGAQARIVPDYTRPVPLPTLTAHRVEDPAPPGPAEPPDSGAGLGIAPAQPLDSVPDWVLGGIAPPAR